MSLRAQLARLSRPSSTPFQYRPRSLHTTAPRRVPASSNHPSSSTSHSHSHAHSYAHSSTHAHTRPAAGSSSTPPKQPSPHLVWYREIVPAMIPILLISSSVFLALSLLRTYLSHSLSLTESTARIAELEAQLERMRRDQRRALEREKRERERILPIVVERVLQKVGAMSEEEEEDDSHVHVV